MSGAINNFYAGTTVVFFATMKLDGVAQDIRTDTVRWRLKTSKGDTDAQAVLTVTADVATYGASGIAAFTITPATTNPLDPAVDTQYYTDLVWILASGAEYVVYDSTVKILARVSDA